MTALMRISLIGGEITMKSQFWETSGCEHPSQNSGGEYDQSKIDRREGPKISLRLETFGMLHNPRTDVRLILYSKRGGECIEAMRWQRALRDGRVNGTDPPLPRISVMILKILTLFVRDSNHNRFVFRRSRTEDLFYRNWEPCICLGSSIGVP